ncbi:MAG: CpaF family protein [Caldiserica bacterium]|nr:MAG: CpaF family protein [Caldisericota bacterium]
MKLEQRVKERKEEQAEEKKEEVTELSPEEAKIALKKKIHQRLLEEFDLKEWNIHTQDESQKQALYKRVRGIIENLIAEEASLPLNRDERSEVVTELVDEVLGLGPLEKFLRDETISEIMVNGPQKIYIEKAGKIYLTDARFTSTEQLMTVIDRILSPIGRRVDESSPLVDARLPDGSRVNVIIPPLSLIGPVITIRKFVAKRLDMDDLVRLGSLTREMVEFLRVCVILRKNILVSGGTGSGKTTLLNMLSSFIPEDERIVTIEDSAELRLRQEHVISLESKPPNIEGKGAIPIRRLVINALRMRPDRIVVGECRGGEALDMLQAMNTGHDGSLTTIHANSPKDAISRLTTMVLMAGTELPERAIREQIASAINIIVQTARLKDGSRKVVKISEVIPLEAGEMKIQDLFYFEQLGYDENKKVVGRFRKCGVLPTFFDEIKIMGLELSEDIFKDEVKV